MKEKKSNRKSRITQNWNIFQIIVVISFFVTGIMVSNAQNRKYISMNDAVSYATKQNANIQIAELEHKIADAEYKQTDAAILPQVSVSYTAESTNNPLNAFGFLLQQGIATTQDFNPSRLNHPDATFNYGTSINANIPILNLDRVYARKGARLQRTAYAYKLAYTKEYITFEVKKAYTQLQFAYQIEHILKKTIIDVKGIRQSVTNFYKQGLVQKSDVLNAQVQVNTVESALAKAESNIQNASEGLTILTGNTLKTTDLYTTDTLEEVITEPDQLVLSKTRSDVMAMKTALEASRMIEKSAYMALLPRINAFGNYQLNDSKIFGFNKNSYLAGISLSWTLFDGNQNKGKIKSANYMTEKKKQELNLFLDEKQQELHQTLRSLHDFLIEIKKYNTSVEQAEEALRILHNRYKEGLASTTDLLMAQAQLSQQEIERTKAIMSYNITKYYTELLTSNH
jgi:outer membrane protein TolC